MHLFIRIRITSNVHSGEDIARRVSHIPTRTWLIGDKRPKTAISEKSNGWEVVKEFDGVDDLNECLVSMKADLTRCTSEFASLSDTSHLLLSCSIYADETPSLYISSEVVAWISEIGADFDIDLYLRLAGS